MNVFYDYQNKILAVAAQNDEVVFYVHPESEELLKLMDIPELQKSVIPKIKFVQS